ncbi:GNAT family N-acetyltransferase [Streptomyces sp. NPDC127098]|uniref:GNAT family N-acetyltransferase n=1 Tax=Streptomyces sp. NPDC127098 TaxID=3347137 RepID=UPI00366006AF
MPVLRRCRGTADEYAAVAVVHRHAAEHDGRDPHSVLEPLPDAEAVAALAGLDQRVVEADGRVVGHVFLTSWLEEDGTRVILHRGRLHPAFRGRGIGTTMLTWAERRAHALAATATTTVLGANAARAEPAATALLLDHGYAPALRLGEYRLPADAALPGTPSAEVEIWPVTDPTDHGRLWDLVELAYHGRPAIPVGTPAARRRFIDRAASMTWLAAWQGNTLAGCAGLAHAPTPHLTELSVHPTFRRRGVGRALLLHALTHARRRHPASADIRLWTNLAGPQRAYELYESVGFQLVEEFVRYRKPMPG